MPLLSTPQWGAESWVRLLEFRGLSLFLPLSVRYCATENSKSQRPFTCTYSFFSDRVPFAFR